MLCQAWKSLGAHLSGTENIYGRGDPCIETVHCVEENWSTWVGILSMKASNSIVTPRKNTIQRFICIPTETIWLAEVRSSRGYRSVVEHSGGVREDSGSNLGVPQHFIMRKMFRSVHQDNCWRRMKIYHVNSKQELVPIRKICLRTQTVSSPT